MKYIYCGIIFLLISINAVVFASDKIDIELPVNISIEDVRKNTPETREKLYNLLRNELKKNEAKNRQRAIKFNSSSGNRTKKSIGIKEELLPCSIIRYTKNGLPIETAPKIYKAFPNTDITFTFTGWDATELSVLQEVVTNYYSVMKTVLGSPGWSRSIEIKKDQTIQYAGLYGDYQILLYFADQHAFIHELVHAFHSPCFFPIGVYEEGMARAVEGIIAPNSKVVYSFGNISNATGDKMQGSYAMFYEQENKIQLSQAGGYVDSYAEYSLAAIPWCKIYFEDNNFFNKLNDAYYSIYNQQIYGKSVLLCVDILKNIIKSIVPVIEGVSFDIWYQNQYALKINSPSGYMFKLHHGGDFSTYDHLDVQLNTRDDNGAYIWPRPYITSSFVLRVYNCNDEKIYEDNKNFDGTGHGLWNVNGYWSGKLDSSTLGGYTGRIKIETGTITDKGLVRDFLYSVVFPYNTNDTQVGLYGVSVYNNSGTIEIPGYGTFPVVNGAFDIQPLKAVSGKITMNFTSLAGQQITRLVYKGEYPYFVMLDYTYPWVDPSKPWPVSGSNLYLMNNPIHPLKGEKIIANWKLDNQSNVTIDIFDLTGQKVITIIDNESYQAGAFEKEWNGANNNGVVVASGVYIVRLKTDQGATWKKAVIIK